MLKTVGVIPTTGTGNNVLADKPSFTNTIGVGGATAAASGAGVTFPATASSSTDPNTLDDYEEGTWTPTVTSTSGTITTLGTVLGFYTKIGQQVTVWASAQVINNGTGAGSLRFLNLPFAPAVNATGAAGYIGAGYNTSSGLLLTARLTDGGAILANRYDFAYPTGSNATTTVCATYFV